MGGYYLFIAYILFLTSCINSNQNKLESNKINSTISDTLLENYGSDKNLRRFDLKFVEQSSFSEILDTLNSIIYNKINSNDIPFVSDTFYKIDKVDISELTKLSWKIFRLKGKYLPSKSTFFIYGSYDDEDKFCYDYLDSLMDIDIAIDYCEASPNNIFIYGRIAQENESLLDVPIEIIAAFHPNYIFIH